MRKPAAVPLLSVSIVALCLFPLAGCNKAAGPGGPPSYAATEAATDAAAAAPDAGEPPAVATEARGESSVAAAKPAVAPVSAPMLAYRYKAELEVPSARLREVMSGHEQACAKAGPALCQVLEASNETDRGLARGALSLRAAPAWLESFRGRLEADAKAAGGKVSRTGVDSEDLTRAIVDTEAALRAKATLRDRLQALLASRPGKLSELLELEQELARVQGEIDAAQSELTVMRARVQTSQMTISYASADQAFAGKTVEPLAKALGGAFGIVMWGLAAIVVVAAFAAPFVLVGIPLVWLFRRWRARRRPRTAPASEA